MNGRHLLDTNAAIAFLENEPPVTELVATLPEVYVALVVLGELYYGAAKSTRVEENRARVDGATEKWTVLYPDLETARCYGAVKSELRRKGRPIPENDLWVAATALQYGLTVLTRDKHFDEIEGVARETW